MGLGHRVQEAGMNALVAFVLWFIASAAATALVLLRIYGA